MLYVYSVTPLSEDHFQERVRDIVEMVRNHVITIPMFCMPLVPEGDPVWDKVSKMEGAYIRYRDALREEGIDSGILVQASLGHGYKIMPNPFQMHVSVMNGKTELACCPEDPAFIEHFSGVMRRLAMLQPKAIMLDDDFRMMLRPTHGCACPYHMAEFNRIAGTNMTREELYEHLRAVPVHEEYRNIYEQTQRDSLVKAAKAFRAAIDEVDPTIQGINCVSGTLCESAHATNPVFAGKGNPTIVRIPNGIYAPLTTRGFSDTMRVASICRATLKNRGIDLILAETDTIPFNRYAKSARYLHAHYTGSLLEGLKGAKHWLYRLSAYEPASGKAYRKILAQHSRFYEKIAQLSDEIQWCGVNSYYVQQDHMCFEEGRHIWNPNEGVWITGTLERMGLPFYFSQHKSNASFLEGHVVDSMSDDQILELFRGNVFMDGLSAQKLQDRGFGNLLGVKVEPWDIMEAAAEAFDEAGMNCCTRQKSPMKLTTISPETEVISYNFRRVDGEARLLAPAVTFYKRDDHATVVYCGSPKAPFTYGEGFAFLNESRKQQFIDLLTRCNALPVYVPGDDELCVRAGYLKDGRLMVTVIDLGVDPVEQLPLYVKEQVESMTQLMPDGDEQPVSFRQTEDGFCTVDCRIESMYPVTLFVKTMN